jgi:uncharacterized membrane protein
MVMSRSKILSFALIASLCINVLMGGFIATQWLDQGKKHVRSGGPSFNHRAAMSVLDQKPQEDVRKLWKARRETLRPYFKEYGEARRQLAMLLSAKVLDENAINLAYDDMLQKRLKIENLLKVSLLEFAAALPPEQRAKFFEEGFSKRKKPTKDKKPNG